MRTYTSTFYVAAPPEVAYSCAADPASFAAMMTEAGGFRFTVLEDAEGEGARVRYEMRALGLALGGTVTITEQVPNEEVLLQWHGTERYVVGDLRVTWNFTPDDGGTKITIRSQFGGTWVPVLDSLAARATIRNVRAEEIPALKAWIEARAAVV